MFERFTEPARQVIVLAQDEARALKHPYIGTEHLLLGVLREENGPGARALATLGVELDDVRAQVELIVGTGDEAPPPQVPFTPRAKKVLELALREGLALGYSSIGTEHILLGVVREGEGVAARILRDLGADARTTRATVLGILGHQAYVPGRRGRRPRPVTWEYRVETWPPATGTERMALLGQLGRAGWELAAAVPLGSASELIFKRPAR